MRRPADPSSDAARPSSRASKGGSAQASSSASSSRGRAGAGSGARRPAGASRGKAAAGKTAGEKKAPRGGAPRSRSGASGTGAARGAEPRRRPAGRGSMRPTIAAVVMVLVLVLSVAVLAPTVQQFVAQRQRIADLQTSNAQTQEQIDLLRSQQTRWSDPAYVRAQARERLLFIVPGETSYLVVDSRPETRTPQPAPASAEQHATEHDWAQAFTQSLVTAGNPPGDAATAGAPAP